MVPRPATPFSRRGTGILRLCITGLQTESILRAREGLKAGTVTPDTKLICSKEATEQAPSKLWLKEDRVDHARRCRSRADLHDKNLEVPERPL